MHSATKRPCHSRMIFFFSQIELLGLFGGNFCIFHIAINIAEKQNITLSVLFQHCAALLLTVPSNIHQQNCQY